MDHTMSIGDSLSSVFEIEELLYSIKDAEDSIKYLQDLKKHRDKIVNNQISTLKSKMETWRQVILKTMELHEPDKNTLPFPGVGKVTRRKVPGSWSVDNEESMLDFFEQSGVKDEVVEKKEVINRKNLKATLDFFDKQNKKVPGVSKSEDRVGLSISHEDDDETPKVKSPKPQSKKQQEAPVDLNVLAV